MQQLKRIRHPAGCDVLFDAKWHQYRIGGTALRSVSKLLDRYFPFDEKRVLDIVAKKTGQTVEAVKQGWTRQALLGKNVHEYIECKLLRKPPPTFTLLMQRRQAREAGRPADSTGPLTTTTTSLEDDMLHGEEALYLPVADRAVERLLSDYDIVGAEEVIASPEWGIAGTIDVLARNRHTHRLLIGDWKTSGSTVSNFRFGSFEAPCPGALRHLPNSKTYRYAMQVFIYGQILAREGYLERNFFDDALRVAMAGPTAMPAAQEAALVDGEGLATASGAVEKKRRRRGGRKGGSSALQSSPIPSPPALEKAEIERLLKDFYHRKAERRFEFGLIQLAKDEQGEVVVEFKAVTPATVLPPDSPETTFESLLRRVMEGEGV